ncbi:MAG TPA: hypothetical protein PLW34_06890 [Termitinemataceae bacterium]|nr:hypothetical protein [Termitinemataceae bacterium]HOM23403.1 hypothetical protein [Termitinemataceae bacterium]HPQ01359.1 hypothetical protein [Termitinemataceae bacterium]
MYKKVLFTLGLVWGAALCGVWGQMNPLYPPVTYGNPDLRNISLGYVIPMLEDELGKPEDQWASSFLKSEGKPPEKPKAPAGQELEPEVLYEYQVSFVSWASMYGPRRLKDNLADTCWVEGVEGPGIGEVVIAAVGDDLKKLGIRIGFQKNKDLYQKNARPRQVKVWLMAAEENVIGDPGYLKNIKVYAVHEVELKDTMGWQPLPLPPIPASVPKTKTEGLDPKHWKPHWLVAIQIVSVYPGSKWEDCCITEIGTMP